MGPTGTSAFRELACGLGWEASYLSHGKSSALQRRHCDVRVNVGIVVDACQAEAEEAEEAGLVALEVGELGEVFGGDGFPALGHQGLHGGCHFPIVHADASGFIGLRVAVVYAIAEEAVHLFNGVLVGALGLHDLVKQGNVERHHGNGRAGLGDEGFVHGNPGFAAERGEFFIEGALGALDVFFRRADGAVFVNGPGELGSDVGVGNRLRAGSDEVFGQQRIDPHFPILTAHDGNGVFDVVALRGSDGHLIDHATGGVEVFVGVGLADGFQHGLVDLAGFRIGAAWGGEAVDDAIDLTEIRFDRGTDLGFHGIGKSIAIERAGVEALGGGGFFKGGGIVPTGGATAVGLGGFFEKYAHGGGTGTEGGGDAGGKSVAGGRADHEHFFRAVGDGSAAFHDGDLFGHVSGTAFRVSGGANESTDFRCDDHEGGSLKVFSRAGNADLIRSTAEGILPNEGEACGVENRGCEFQIIHMHGEQGIPLIDR